MDGVVLGFSMIRFIHKPKPRALNQRGYILLVLMFFVAVLAIGSLAMVERISFRMQRDREEELIHRGVQYSRAIRKYFKKFGRYPTRVEDLENTNNIRFLRRRYKDPITGKDFKLLHMNDVQISFNPGAASMLPPTAEANVSADQPRPLSANPASPNAPANAMTPSTPQLPDQPVNAPADQAQQNPTDQTDATSSAASSSPQPKPLSSTGPGGTPQTFGGGAIIGVASTSKDRTIREFNRKNHYNQWQFIYDPSTDRGGLLMTPNQPPLQGAMPVNQNPNQQNGLQGNQGQTFGGNSGFGTSSGTNPTPPQPNPQAPNQQ